MLTRKCYMTQSIGSLNFKTIFTTFFYICPDEVLPPEHLNQSQLQNPNNALESLCTDF
jgi:hypothetical protein